MPELSRFYGIIIRMYCEVGPHHSPHFHAYHGDDEAVYGVKQHLFCKSRISEVGHLASMVR
jgi:hypothetical protein